MPDKRLEISIVFRGKKSPARDGRCGNDTVRKGSRTSSRCIEQPGSFIGEFSTDRQYAAEDLGNQCAVLIRQWPAPELSPSHRTHFNRNPFLQPTKHRLGKRRGGIPGKPYQVVRIEMDRRRDHASFSGANHGRFGSRYRHQGNDPECAPSTEPRRRVDE